jgi:hypothetical protein
MDLPLPDGPMMAATSPAANRKVTSARPAGHPPVGLSRAVDRHNVAGQLRDGVLLSHDGPNDVNDTQSRAVEGASESMVKPASPPK